MEDQQKPEPQLSILIVDDDEDLAQSLRDLLELEGYSPAVCHSGEAAISIIEETGFDLALIDIRLPDMPGLELVWELRKRDPEIESIIITGYGTVELASRAVGDKGITAFWNKPVDQEQLLAFLGQVARRHQAEKEAKSAIELYQLVAENVADVIWIVNNEMRFVYVSPSVSTVLGYSSEEMTGMHVRHVLTKESFELASQAMYEAISQTNLPLESSEAPLISRRIELEVVRKNGTGIWAENNIRPMLDGNGRFSMLLGISRDITERRKSRQMLEHSEASLAEAQRIARVGSWELDITTSDVHWSDEMFRIFGYQPGEINPTFRAFMDLVHSEDRGFVESSINEALYEGALYNVDHRVIRPDGTELVVHEQGEVEYDKAGKPVRLVGTTHDITELKQTEEKLRALSRRLLKVQEEERRAIGQDLHDQVGQSITVLKLMLDKALRSANPEVEKTLEKAVSVADELVRQIREISSELVPRMLDDLGLLPSLLWQTEKLKERTGVNIDFRHSGLEKRIPAELAIAAFRITQEAMTNAVRHSGTEEIVFKASADDETLRLSIEDHGRGFDFANLRHELTGGIVGIEERVDLLGGKMEIDTSPGIGTRLHVTLPLSAGTLKEQ
ncbi:MAG: PAS domain S-box protein [Dehalococcoidia bacterium]